MGFSAAYHLAIRRAGLIILLEKDMLGDGASGRAAGITTGLLWSETGVRVRQLSLQTFRVWAEDFEGYTFHDDLGCLNLFTPDAWAARAALLPMYERLGAPYEVLSAEAVRHRWPALEPTDDLIALHDPHGGYSEPDELVPALRERVIQLGVTLREGTRVREVSIRDGRVRGVICDGRTFGADIVISTSHAWSAALLQTAGVTIPVKHFVHQRYLTKSLFDAPGFPPVNADPYGGYVRPASGRSLLMGVETPDRFEHRVESTGFHMDDLEVDDSVRDPATARLAALLPVLADAPWRERRAGLISFSMDGEPLLGPVRGIEGLYLAAGFHSGGFSYSPAVGQLLAEWVVDGQSTLDVTPFAPDRFEQLSDEKSFLQRTLRQRDTVRRRH